jgi:glycine oxidase
MSSSPDVLILGGGVIGLTTAYFLAREGLHVEVLDRSTFGQEASWAGAGIIPPGNPSRARPPHDLFRAQSSALFPRLSQDLREATGIDNGYRVCGGLEWLSEQDSPVLQAWREEGLRVEKVSAKQFPAVEPALDTGLEAAYFLPDMAQVRNPRHIKALLAWCRTHGVELRADCTVHGFEKRAGRITAVTTNEGALTADRFLLAAGAWTEDLLRQIGWIPGIRPVRGQIALLHTGTPLLRRILLQGKRYVVPRDDGRVLVGSTEEEAGFEKRTTAAAIADLLLFARSLVPELAAAHVEQCWAGLRPGSPDGWPFLGPVPGFANLFIAAGHFRAGIQLSPATGQMMTDLLVGRKPTVPLEAFRLDRSRTSPVQAAFRS